MAKPIRRNAKENFEDKLDKECTFKPNTGNNITKFSLQSFLERQEHHIRKKQEFCSAMSKEKEKTELEALRNKPVISDSSKQIASNMGSTNDRLLGLKSDTELTSARHRAELKGITKESLLVLFY